MPYKDKKVRAAKNKEYQKKYYQANKEYYIRKAAEKKEAMRIWFNDLKSFLKCSNCPENNAICLDFHHRDPKKKEIGLSAVVQQGWSENRILKEIEKCDVLCSNCHKKLHAKLSRDKLTVGYLAHNQGSSGSNPDSAIEHR